MTDLTTHLLQIPKLDPASPLPVAVQLADHMRQRIVAGLWQPGQRLPSASALAQEFGTSVFPVSQALQRLQREGLVVAQRGVATYVSADLMDRRKVLHVMLNFEAADELVAEFRARHPKYKVVQLPYVGDGSECDRLLAGTGAPDLISFGSEAFSRLAMGDRLSEIDESVLASSDQDTLVNVEHMCRYRGKQFGVALSVLPFVWLARRSVFEGSGEPLPGPSWTGEDMLEVIRRLTQDRNGDGVLDQFGYLLTSRGYTWYALFHALGGSIESWDAFASPQSRTAAHKVWEAIFRHHISPPHIGGASNRYGPLLMAVAETARVGLILADLYSLKECARRFGDDVVPLRSPLMPNGKRSSIAVCQGVGIPKRAVCRDGALKLIRFLRSAEAQRRLCAGYQLLPVRLGLWDEVCEGRRDWAWLLLQEVSAAATVHQSDVPAEMEATQKLMEPLIRGLILPEEFDRRVDAKRRGTRFLR